MSFSVTDGEEGCVFSPFLITVMKEPITKLREVSKTEFSIVENELRIYFNARKQLALQMLSETNESAYKALKKRFKFTELKLRSLLEIQCEEDEEINELHRNFF